MFLVSVQFFEAASRRIGAILVNIIRISTALVLFSCYLYSRHGYLIPLHFPARAWLYLGLSGAIGFFLGDICLFKALVELGPRLALLMFSLSAPMTAILGWAFLGETYLPMQWAGMLVTLTGVCMVILEKNSKLPLPGQKFSRKANFKGVLFGIGAMLGQAGGYVLSKAGMQTAEGFLDPFAATQIRAFACFILFFTLTRKWGQVATAVKDIRDVAFTTAGAVIGPFIGVSLSLMVLQYFTAGIASTFLSLTPICIIPFSIYIHKEHVSMKAFTGAVIAVAGIWLLMYK
nr:DMT family transporter [Desulforhopalus vacuolatus]